MPKKSHRDYQIIRNDEIDLKALILVLWTGKWSLVKIALSTLPLAIIYLIFATTLYYSNSIIVPTDDASSSAMSSISSLASTVGLDMGSSSDGISVDIADYASSRQLRNTLLETPWTNKKGETINLIDEWGISDTSGFLSTLGSAIRSITGAEAKTSEEVHLKWLEAGRNILEERVIARHIENGLIMVEVWMEDPVLAMNIANFVVQNSIDFTKETKVKSWSENKQFLSKRMGEVSIALQAAEDKMTQFQKDNRRIIDSPELSIELANLRREVEIKTQLYIGLQNQYEFARMEEAKDQTGIVVLDPAYYPVEAASPKKVMVIIISLILGGIISVPGFLIYRGFRP